MDTTKYRSKSIYVEHINKANKLGMTMNEYIAHLADLAAKERTAEQAQDVERLNKLEGIVASMTEALKHQRYMMDSQAKKIDQQLELNEQMATMLNKLLNAYSADIEFIQALKKEITA